MENMIKSANGKFLWANNGGGYSAMFYSLGGNTWETFTLVNVSKGVFAIKCYNNVNYIDATNNGGSNVTASASSIINSAKFTAIKNADGTYSFKCYDGVHYLTAVNGGGNAMAATATSIGVNEKFVVSNFDYTPDIVTPDTYTVSNLIQGPFARPNDTNVVSNPVVGVKYYFRWTVKSSGLQPYSVLYDFSDSNDWFWIGGAQQNYKTTNNVTVTFEKIFGSAGSYTARMHIYNALISTNGGVYYA